MNGPAWDQVCCRGLGSIDMSSLSAVRVRSAGFSSNLLGEFVRATAERPRPGPIFAILQTIYDAARTKPDERRTVACCAPSLRRPPRDMVACSELPLD